MGSKDITFGFDRYKEAELSDRKTTIANTIVNACFMVPGNEPNLPLNGVNIRQYFFKEENAISTEKIRSDLEMTCGRVIAGATIGNVDFSTQKMPNGELIFLLIVMVNFGPSEQELLGISMAQDREKYVRFNFDYVKLDE